MVGQQSNIHVLGPPSHPWMQVSPGMFSYANGEDCKRAKSHDTGEPFAGICHPRQRRRCFFANRLLD